MKIDWLFSAQTMLDQLPSAVQTSVLDGLARMEDDIAPDGRLPDELKLIGRRPTGDVYSFLVLPDWRLTIRKDNRGLTVTDVARREQLGQLRALARQE